MRYPEEQKRHRNKTTYQRAALAWIDRLPEEPDDAEQADIDARVARMERERAGGGRP